MWTCHKFLIRLCAISSARNTRWMQRTAHSLTSCAGIHKAHTWTYLKHLPATSVCRCLPGHSHPHLVWALSTRFQITFHYFMVTHQLKLFWYLLHSKFSGFFKVKCHIYCSIYVFCKNLTKEKLCFCFIPYLLCVSIIKFKTKIFLNNEIFECCSPDLISLLSPVLFTLKVCVMGDDWGDTLCCSITEPTYEVYSPTLSI